MEKNKFINGILLYGKVAYLVAIGLNILFLITHIFQYNQYGEYKYLVYLSDSCVAFVESCFLFYFFVVATRSYQNGNDKGLEWSKQSPKIGKLFCLVGIMDLFNIAYEFILEKRYGIFENHKYQSKDAWSGAMNLIEGNGDYLAKVSHFMIPRPYGFFALCCGIFLVLHSSTLKSKQLL